VHGLQADLLYDPAQYDVFTATLGEQTDLTRVEARVIAPGTLRVVVFRAPSSGLAPGLVFSVPLRAKTGVVEPFPVVLTNFLLVGEDASDVDTRLIPQIRLLTLRDGARINGRLGIELAVDARATGATVTRVEYFVGGVLIGEGTGDNFRLRWQPPSSGPYEIRAIAYDSGGLEASSRTIPLDIAHVDTFAGAVRGSYAGLIRAESPHWDTAGYVTMTSATNGTFTYRVLMGGRALAGRGRFDEDGVAEIAVPRRRDTPLSMQLTHSSDPEVDQIVGRLTDGSFDGPVVQGGSFVTEFQVDRLIWHSRSNPAAIYAGDYTVLLPASEEAETQGAPGGAGHAVARVGANGSIRLTGQLADNERLSHATFLSKAGLWPLYRPLYRKQGLVIGEIALRNLPGVSDGDGKVDWIRHPNDRSAVYPAGFETRPALLMSRYEAPARFARPLVLKHWGGNALVSLGDPSLSEPLERLATMNPGGAVLVPPQGGERLAVAVTARTGTTRATFFHPQTGSRTTAAGVVFQKQNLAAGAYLSGGRGGSFYLEPSPGMEPEAGDELAAGSSPLPRLAISAPRAEAVLEPADGIIEVRGTAQDPQGIAEIWCQVLRNGELSAPALAAGTTAWSFAVAVPPGEGGRYTVTAKAVDKSGDESLLATRSFLAAGLTELEITVEGPGSVSRGLAGITERQVGRLVTVTATPARGKRFLGWSGSLESPARTISFLMEEGMILKANFAN